MACMCSSVAFGSIHISSWLLLYKGVDTFLAQILNGSEPLSDSARAKGGSLRALLSKVSLSYVRVCTVGWNR